MWFLWKIKFNHRKWKWEHFLMPLIIDWNYFCEVEFYFPGDEEEMLIFRAGSLLQSEVQLNEAAPEETSSERFASFLSRVLFWHSGTVTLHDNFVRVHQMYGISRDCAISIAPSHGLSLLHKGFKWLPTNCLFLGDGLDPCHEPLSIVHQALCLSDLVP